MPLLDVPHLLGWHGDADVQIFHGTANSFIAAPVEGHQWRTWSKPRGKSMCWILAVGSGGGGGGGLSRTAGNPGGGGGGGASGAHSKFTGPVSMLPDILYIFVGMGGKGNTAAQAGTAGNGIPSAIAFYPHFTGPNYLLVSGGGNAVGGGTGTAGAAGAAGTPESAYGFGSNGSILSGVGIIEAIGGMSGALGGAPTSTGNNGVSVAMPSTRNINLGAPGGGATVTADFAGGAISLSGNPFVWLETMAPVGGAAGSVDGSSGYALWKPLYGFCGLGGGSSNAGVGGNGGHGALGGGGAGGGAGTTGGTGGTGGDGVIVIICW